jgi:hypothetical protein
MNFYCDVIKIVAIRRFIAAFTGALHHPYPEPGQSSLTHPISPLQDASSYYSPIYVLVLLVVYFPLTFLPIALTHSCYMPHPSHPPRFDY